MHGNPGALWVKPSGITPQSPHGQGSIPVDERAALEFLQDVRLVISVNRRKT